MLHLCTERQKEVTRYQHISKILCQRNNHHLNGLLRELCKAHCCFWAQHKDPKAQMYSCTVEQYG